MMLAKALLLALRDHGAREIFGIPGDYALPFFQVIEETAILPLYTLSHEPGVAFAADAAARLNCTLGVVAVTYGAGALNLVNAVAGAYAEKSPIVVISGAPGLAERQGNLSLHHQAKTIGSQFDIFREITCDQVQLDDPAQAPAEIARVLRSCRDWSQPVYIELPRDVCALESAPVPEAIPSPADPDALEACAKDVLDRLSQARSPVLMVGVEVRRYGLESEVAQLASRLGLPVVTSFMGRGVLAESSVPPQGTYLGAAGNTDIARLVEESDGLFMLGVILSDTNLGVSANRIDLRTAIHALNRQLRVGYHIYQQIPLASLVDALLQQTEASAAPNRPVNPPRQYPRGMAADDRPIRPGDIACAVNDLIVEHPMPVIADVGDCLFMAMDIEYTELIAPGYYASMGFAVPAGFGVQAAGGRRPLILVGDGAFQMTGMELGNCARYGFDPIVLLLNNKGWGMMRVFQPKAQFTELADWHYAELATCLGGTGQRVNTRAELQDALQRAVAGQGKFQLIEVMLPRDEYSPTLSGFTQGIQGSQEIPGKTTA